MKLRLNLSLRRALMAAMAVATTLVSSAWAGVADARYDLQYYLDFCRNKGVFAAGSTNIDVYFKDGSSVQNPTIPIMPNLDGYAWSGSVLQDGTFAPGGGVGLVNPQYVASAHHCGELNVYFLSEGADTSVGYTSSGYTSSGSLTYDWNAQRLNKIVTEVTYNPLADSSVLANLKKNDWIYRLGNGGVYSTDGYKLSVNQNAIGGMVNVDYTQLLGDGETWRVVCTPRKDDVSGDVRPPLEIGVTAGDSGSPNYVWDKESQQFLFLGFISQGNPIANYGAFLWMHSNPNAVLNFIDKYTDEVSGFSADSTIIWGAQDASTGQGVLSQGDVSFTYRGKGTANTDKDTYGLLFNAEDAAVRRIELEGSVNMGAGSLTFDSGNWVLAEKNAGDTFNSAGFVVNSGAELTLELTGTANEEWRKVGEGTMTIAGEGANDAVLRVGGGTTKYDVTYDEAGNIAGCTLGNIGETRLDRTNGYAASSIRLEAGTAIIVLMQDGQFKTNSVGGDTFTFGNDGGLLNLNGHDLIWGVINQDGSGVGARIGNKTPLGEETPGLSTFTYTGTGTFAGCFVDEGASSTAQLAVVYNNASGGTWKLTGNNSNVGGYTVEKGTLVLEGYNTPHVNMHDANDWSYATLEGSDVTVKAGATFQLSHHALMTGDVIVNDGASFIMNQAVNADAESIHGSLRQDMVGREITSLVGNVHLHGNTSMMTANVQSSAITKLDGSVSIAADYNWDVTPNTQFVKNGNGVLVVTGNVNVPSVQINAGGLVIESADRTNWHYWSIGEQGFLAANGVDYSDALYFNITKDSAGVFALTKDQGSQLNLSKHTNLYIGAWGDVSYGAANTTEALTAYNNKWLLGGGTGTLTVNFRLTGENDLIIGNDYSSGTVHLTNTQNDFTGEIIIKGTGNKLTFEQGALSSNAGVTLTYGNALALYDADQISIVKNAMNGAQGVLALATSDALNMGSSLLALGADGDFTYTGALSVDSTYRFGGSGNLTVATELDGSKTMEIDGQGTTGSSVTFAREQAFTGAIVAGAGLGLADKNSAGDISIHVGHAAALAAAESIQLQKGATLHTDGNNITVQNLTAETGSSIRNDGATNSMLELSVTPGVNTSIADGVLDGGDIHILKTGEGTLTLGSNRTWSGGLTIAEGTVKGKVYADSTNVMVGLGSEDSTIYVDKDGVLDLNFRGSSSIGGDKAVSSGRLSTTLLPQRVAGTGTIRISAGDNGGTVLFSNQNAGFSGTMEIVNNTRLYIGHQLFESIMNQKVSYNNVAVFNKATIDVKSGSQVRLTNQWIYGPVNAAPVVSEADFIIAGHGFAGADDRTYGNQNNTLATGGLTSGALSIDLGSVINGTVTLADHATIASHSHIVTNQTNKFEGYMYGQVTYGLPEGKLGGTIRGQILGEGKDLTFAGEEGMTITADSANTYRNLIIASSNGHRNDDKFALNLDGGQAVSQTSTALGTGTVTLGEGLILRLAGTGVENNTDVVYTYENTIDAGNNATLQSYNITNVLSGTVAMKGDSLNLATSKGGVLQLAGGVQGSGTLNVAAGSRVILGSAAAGFGLTREGTPQFSGTVVAGAGADITLASPAVVATGTTFSGTDNLTLSFIGTEDYTLGGITVSGDNSALTLHFDFTQPGASDWTTLNSAISAGTTTIALDLNMFNEMASGEYTLISGNLGTGNYVMDSSLSNRFSCRIDGDNLILVVGGDDRLYWSSAEGTTQTWEGSNWQVGGAGNLTQYSGTQEVMLTDSGLSTPGTREVISLNEVITVGQVNVSSIYGVEGAGSLTGSKLVVGNGGDLQLGVNATFSNGVQVAGEDSVLAVDGSVLNATVQVSDGAALAVRNNATLSGNVTLTDASLQVTEAKVSGRIILPGSLTNGAILGTMDGNGNITYTTGTLTATHSTEFGSEMSLGAGTLTFDQAMQLDKLSLGSNAAAVLRNATYTDGQSKRIGSLEMGTEASLSLDNRNQGNTSDSAVIDELTLTGTSATIKEVHGAGHLKVGTLSMAEGVSSATLNLQKASMSATTPYTTIFEFGSATAEAGNFAGVVNLSQEYAHSGDNGKKHSAFINLSGAETFANAVVQMNKQAGPNAYLGLGINVGGEGGSATVAGLVSAESLGNRAFVFSGYAPQDIGWNTGDGFDKNQDEVARTLIIDTDAGANHAFYGQVREKLSIVKRGEGTQAFYGASSVFDGAISVEAGSLAFNAASKGMLTTSSGVTISGGTLDLSAIAFGEDETNAISLSETSSITFSEGASIAFGSMEADKVYSIFSVNGELTGWNTDVLSAEHVTINGSKLSEMYRSADSVSLTYGWDGSFSYSVVGADLTWLGGTNGNWDTSTSNWDITPDVAGDSTTFYQFDNVVFRDTADTTVTLSEDIVAGRVDIQDTHKHTFKGAAKSLVVDTLTSKGMVVVGGGDVFSLTINESSDIDGDLDVYWGATLNLKGLNHDINKLITRANSTSSSAVNFNALSATIGSIEMKNKSAINFGLAEGATTASYTVTGAISISTNTTTERSLSVASGVSLQAGSLSNTHGLGTLDVDGSMTLSGNLSYTAQGNITGDGSLIVSGNASFGNTTDVSIESMTVNGTTTIGGTFTISGGVVNLNGSTTKTGGTLTIQRGELNFNGPTTLDSLSATGGTTNFNGATTLTSASFNGGTVNFASNNAQVGAIVRGSGNINFKLAEGLSSTTYTVGDITGTCSGNMTVESGVTVNANSINYNGDHFVGGSRTLTVDGVLALAGNLSLAKHAASGETITGTGILNVGGNANISIHDGAININVAQLNVDGNLSMGTYAWGPRHANLSGGITTVKGHFYHNAGGSGQGDYLKLNINGGSLVMQGGATISKGELNIVSGSLHQAGGTSTISNTFSMTGGELKVTGGTLSISSTPTVSGGDVSISGGELVLGSGALLEGVSSFTLSGTGELDLSAITFGTDATNAIALKSNAVFTFSDTLDNEGGLVFDLGALTEGVTYQIFDLNADNTTLNGWNADILDLGNFRINGTLLNEMENAGITLGEDGTFSYTLANENNPDVLYWVGGETGTWNTADAVWNTTPDDMEDENTAFSTDAHVAFNTSAAVDIAGSVQAASVAVEGEDTTLSLKSGSLTVADMYLEGTLDMASGVTLTVNNTEEVSISGITGSGTLVKDGSSTLELGDAELVKLSLQSGATNVTGEVTLSGQLSVGAATLNIESGAVVTANQLTGGNEGDNHPSSININGGELYITGSTNHAMNNDSCTSNSILLAHWKSSNTVLTLNSGKLVAEDAVLNTSRDSKGTFKALGGEATLLGIDLMGHDNQNRDGQFDLGTATTGSAVVTLGSRGIKNVSRGAVVNLGEGTLKASADFSIDGNNTVSLIGTVNGTIFDTNAHNITVNTVLTGSGKLVKNGAGELTFTKANTYSGATTINGGSIVLDLGTTTNAGGENVNSEYTLGGTVSGSGTFSVSTGTTLNVAAGKTLTADLLVDGGVVKVSASDNQVLAGDITVQNGGRLTTSANNGTDAFSYNHSADTGKLQLVVDGGTVDFGSTRQTIKNWDITLKNGARLEGTGGSYTIDNGSHKASIDVLDVALTVNASGAGNEIAGSTRLRGGQTITYNVAEDADLKVSGLVHSDGKANQGNVVKSGDGKLVMTAANTYANTTSITGGTLELQGAGQVGSSQVSIASGAQLTAATTATADTESETWASISAAEGTTATLSAATVTQTESCKTLNIAAKTAGTQGTMTNSLVQIAANASLTVDSMIISASSRISGSTNYAVREAENYVSQLSLTNSVVELADSNATIAGPSTASALTLQTIGASGEALNLAGHSQVLTITSDALSSLTLTGGSSFVIDFSSLLSSTELADVDFVALNFSDVSYADDFWTNATTQVSGLVGADRLVAYYMPSTPDVGIYFDVRSIPEPTSTTLSLLALAALVSRRRRK